MNELLIRVKKTPRCEYGKRPEDRTVDELLKWGVINLDKPAGPTSHQIVAWLKGILDIKKAGHGGTLDPKVTGVLPIAIGRATKAIKVLLTGNKEYVGAMILHRDVTKKKLRTVFNEFKGKIYQIPPVRSAVKRSLRSRSIYDSEILQIKKRKVLFRVSCEAGTYIRTYCHDMGEALGVGAHMAQLRRIRTASFKEDTCVTLHNVKDAFVYWKENGEEEHLRKIIHPFERLFDHMPKVIVKDVAASAVTHGAPLAVVGIVKLGHGIKAGDLLAIVSGHGEALAIGRASMSSEEMMEMKKGIAVKIERVLKDDSFPKLWKRKERT